MYFIYICFLPSLSHKTTTVEQKLLQQEKKMVPRQVMYMFLSLLTVTFLCSSMPVMAKSSSDTGTVKSSKSVKKSKTSSSKSSKKSKSKTSSSKSSKKSSKKTAKSTARVNVNKATAAELTEIAGIGPKTADKIVAYRKKHGKFKKADDLLQVNGIGEKTLKKIKSHIKF
jgi:competence protein ComEA